MWYCPKCGHVVVADEMPQPMRWDDGHICYFRPEEKAGEAIKISQQKAQEELNNRRPK